MAREGSGEGLAHSLVDLMTSLLVIFILLLVVFLYQASIREIAERKGTKGTEDNRKIVQARLDPVLRKLGEGIELFPDACDPLTLVIIVPRQLLDFEKNDDKIRDDGKHFLDFFAPAVASVLCEQSLLDTVDSLVAEGHTDSAGNEGINIPLSARRATNVVLYSREVLTHSSNGLEPCLLELASATGRGPRDLIHRNEVIQNRRVEEGCRRGTADVAAKFSTEPEDRDRSRRVEFKIRVRSEEQRRVEKERLSLGQ